MQSKPNPVCWFEIYVNDLERATKFYETVFQLKLEEMPSPMPNLKMMAFPMEMTAPGASGTLCKMEGICGGGNSTIIYFNCEDCGVEADRIEAAGGKIQMPKTSIGQYGSMALGIDTEGNIFGLHSAPA